MSMARKRGQRLVTKNHKDVEIYLTAEPEDIPFEGHFDSGEPELDKKDEANIARELDRGNQWAWCTAHVKVVFKGIIEADAYLGACSYNNEKEFKDDGYYDDMVSECLNEINKKLAKLNA